jgi:hypothetical protein
MRELNAAYTKLNRNQITNTTDYFNELLDQFFIDCGPEDLKDVPEAKECWKQLKRFKRQIKTVNKIEQKLFGM